VDLEFECRDCGRHEVWTARQQKWYYEVAKGSLYATAVRCRNCRRKRREAKGDPNKLKHPGTLLKRLRNEIEPGLVEAGFVFDRCHSDRRLWQYWLDYSRGGLLLRCLFDGCAGRLIAETLDENAKYTMVANSEMCWSRTDDSKLIVVQEFAAAVVSAALSQ